MLRGLASTFPIRLWQSCEELCGSPSTRRARSSEIAAAACSTAFPSETRGNDHSQNFRESLPIGTWPDVAARISPWDSRPGAHQAAFRCPAARTDLHPANLLRL